MCFMYDAVMSNPQRRPPCCSKFSGLALDFVDESVHLDASLWLLAELCSAASNMEALSTQTLSELGNSIKNYLGKRLVLEHFFFGRTIHPLTLEDSLVRSELLRLIDRLPEEARFSRNRK